MSAVEDFFKWIMNEIGYAVCHQFTERSLHYGGRKLPVCARDTGFFLAFAACFVVLLLVYGRSGRRYPPVAMVVAIGVLILPTVVDAITSYAGLRESINAVREITGALAGTGAAALLFPLASSRMFKGDEGRTVLERWWSLPLLLLVPAAVSLALWPDWPGAFWFWSVLVTLSILLTLLILNYTLVSLLLDWIRGEDRVPGVKVIIVFAAFMALAEIVIANRLHWIFEKIIF
ncbi:MAG: DUF2085 domain-containing protein [Actinobacteria bacterium]|nr:DUF2085 domain-containing protein [Actinomycetota bacterium]